MAHRHRKFRSYRRGRKENLERGSVSQSLAEYEVELIIHYICKERNSSNLRSFVSTGDGEISPTSHCLDSKPIISCH